MNDTPQTLEKDVRDGDYVEVGKYKTRRTLCEGVILPLGTLSLLVAVADT